MKRYKRRIALSDITAEIVRDRYIYDPDTGIFIRRMTMCGRAQFGQVAGSLKKAGYIAISILDRPVMAHRLAWLYVYGEWPDGEVDHINGIRSDNRISNLRIATGAQNRQNAKIRKDNRSGFKGVSLHGNSGKWQATIALNGKRHYLGLHESPQDAHKEYCKAALELHGEFARTE